MAHLKTLAIVGATGNIGRNIASILHERDFPFKTLHLVSEKSAGEALTFGEAEYIIQAIDTFDFCGVDLVFFAKSLENSQIYVPKALAAGCRVIDNTAMFRENSQTPIMLPEVNGDDIALAEQSKVAVSGHCVSNFLALVLHPINQLWPIKRVVSCTYLSVSGYGYKGEVNLRDVSRAVLDDQPHNDGLFPAEIGFNVVPQIDAFIDDGRTIAEWKMEHDTNRIMGTHIKVAATSVRVPVFRGHSQAVNIECHDAVDIERVKTALHNAPWLHVETSVDGYETPRETVGTDPIFVGRIRRDHTTNNGIQLWLTGDNLRKGTALNNVQIAEMWAEHISV